MDSFHWFIIIVVGILSWTIIRVTMIIKNHPGRKWEIEFRDPYEKKG